MYNDSDSDETGPFTSDSRLGLDVCDWDSTAQNAQYSNVLKARQSGDRRFKSRFSKFFFVHPILSKICTQSVSLVVYYMTF